MVAFRVCKSNFSLRGTSPITLKSDITQCMAASSQILASRVERTRTERRNVSGEEDRQMHATFIYTTVRSYTDLHVWTEIFVTGKNAMTRRITMTSDLHRLITSSMGLADITLASRPISLKKYFGCVRDDSLGCGGITILIHIIIWLSSDLYDKVRYILGHMKEEKLTNRLRISPYFTIYRRSYSYQHRSPRICSTNAFSALTYSTLDNLLPQKQANLPSEVLYSMNKISSPSSSVGYFNRL